MGNRTMAAKRLKATRQRRAWAKPLMRSSGIIPNKGVLAEYKERALGLGISEAEVDQFIRDRYKRDPIESVPPGRVEARELAKEMRLRQPGLMHYQLFDNSRQRDLLWHTSDRTCWVITSHDKQTDIRSVSIEYGTEERARNVHASGKVRWVLHEPYTPIQSGMCPPLIAIGR